MQNHIPYVLGVLFAFVALGLGMFGTMIATYPNAEVLSRMHAMTLLELRLLGALMLAGASSLIWTIVRRPGN